MGSVYLQARPESTGKSGRVRNPGRIVRAAEERFAQAGAERVSLADLCAATGVSKSALYLAFENWCGEPPVAYFHKRRLTHARTLLLDAEPVRGAVKRAALHVGLGELGRFSRDYQRLFGESPSSTLSRPSSADSVRNP
jgi:AraC-like DNA-binding protein